MHIKRPLVPGFLNKLDNYLLKNKPLIWSTRAHLALYFCLLFIAILTLVAYIFPDDPRNRSVLTDWTGFIIIISVIAMVVWLIYLLRFNLFKRFGNITPAGTLISFILYLITTLFIVFFAFIPSLVECYKANKTYSDIDLVTDINSINIKIAQLEHDTREHQWKSDSVIIVNKLKSEDYYNKGNYDNSMDTIAVADGSGLVKYRINRGYGTIDTTQLRIRLVTDSAIKINDTMYAFYEAPEYNFLDLYQARSANTKTRSKVNTLTNAEIYNNIIRNFKQPDKQTVKSQLAALILKYTQGTNYHASYEFTKAQLTYRNMMLRKYDLDTVKDSMENIFRRKNGIKDFLPGLIHLLYYISLVFSLLIFIFRHSTTPTYFLSVLSAFIITTISAVIIAFSRYNESTMLAFIITYFVLFLVLASMVWRNRTRTIVTGIAINLFVFLIPFMPMVITFYCFRLYEKKYSNDSNMSARIADLQDQFIPYAEIGGFVLLLVLIATYVHSLYRKWYTLRWNSGPWLEL